MFNGKRIFAALSATVALNFAFCVDANAISLQQAIEKTMKTNPQILQAAKDREAIEFDVTGLREDGLLVPSPSSKVEYVDVAV